LTAAADIAIHHTTEVATKQDPTNTTTSNLHFSNSANNNPPKHHHNRSQKCSSDGDRQDASPTYDEVPTNPICKQYRPERPDLNQLPALD
jgi:hypothetical protein